MRGFGEVVISASVSHCCLLVLPTYQVGNDCNNYWYSSCWSHVGDWSVGKVVVGTRWQLQSCNSCGLLELETNPAHPRERQKWA